MGGKDIEFVTPIRRLTRFVVGQRVIYSGRTNYSYIDGKEMRYSVSKEFATIIVKNEDRVVIKFDNYRKPYRTESSLKYMDAVDVIPPHQYAVVTECDLACGDKILTEIN